MAVEKKAASGGAHKTGAIRTAAGSAGEPDQSPRAILRLIREGLPFSSLKAVQTNYDLSLNQLATVLHISTRTLERRRVEGNLDAQTSDRVLRLTRVFNEVSDLFEGDQLACRQWLKQPNTALEGLTPEEMIGTEEWRLFVMIQAWRICKPQYASSAFDGLGAANHPGRWNSKGQKLVYTADSPALALLEIMVHSSPALALLYHLISCSFDESLVETLDPSILPSDWKNLVDPNWKPLQQLGSEWYKSARSAVLKVPTALVPQQWNYLLNPEHPDFVHVKTGEAVSFAPDPRL